MAKREGIMLCYPFEESRLLKWEPPYIVQPKLDGERCRGLSTGMGPLLISSEKNIITSVPHISKAVQQLNLPEGTELDGELYLHNLPFDDIHSIVSRKVNLHDEAESMEYHIFDIIPVDDPGMIQGNRYALLRDQINLSWPLVKVPTFIIWTIQDFLKYYDMFLEMGYEGIIVRNVYYPYERKRCTGVMKFKPKKKDFYEIIGLLEAIDKHGQPKGTLGAFLCRGDDGTPFKVGAGKLNHDERERIWKEHLEDSAAFLGLLCEVQYQNLTANHVPRFGLCVKKPSEAAQTDSSDAFIKSLLVRR